MTFGQAIAACFKKYANGQGRAQRSEYWFFFLFTALVGTVLGFIRGIFTDPAGHLTGPGLLVGLVAAVFNLGTLVPSVAVSTRRLHDTGRSGYWILISITVIGLIPLIIWYCTPGKPGENQYGRNPLDPRIEDVF